MTQPSDKLPMTLEDQVTNFQDSKRLCELHVRQESLYGWVEKWHWDGKTHDGKSWKADEEPYLDNYWNNQNPKLVASAFTVAELGKQLPSNLDEFVRENLDDLNRELYFDWCNTDHPYYNPDLLAKMLIYLLENKLI